MPCALSSERSSGYIVHGVDISSEQVALARAACPQARFTTGSMYDLTAADGEHDVIWAAASLLHIPKDRAPQAVSEMCRVLRTGGAAAIIVKQGDGEAVRDGPLGPRFFAYYEIDELADLLDQAGLRPVRVDIRDKPGGPWLVAYASAS